MSVSVGDCERCASPLAPGDLRCAICGQSTPRASESRVSLHVDVLRCEECGASVSYDASVRAPRCAFCGAVMKLEELADPVEQADRWLPFTVDADAARAALRRWLGSLGWFRPSDLRSEAAIDSLRPLWWVAWIFDAEALVSWTCDANVGGRRSDWAPYAGQERLVFDDILVSASRGLTDAEAYALAPSYDLRSAAEGVPADGDRGGDQNGGHDESGPALERFDVQRSQARARVLDAIRRVATARVEADCAPGTRQRNVHTAALLRRLETRRVALPAHVLAYRYRGALYRVVISGQDARCVRGSAPYSAAKIALVVAIALAALLAIAAIALVASSS